MTSAQVAAARPPWWQRMLAVHPGRIPWWGGLRAAIAFGIPLGIGVGFGELVLGLVGGLGGFFVVSCDIGGAYRGRGGTIVTTLLLSAAALVVGAVAFQSAWVAAIVLLVLGAAAGTAALAGVAPAVASTSALITLTVSYGLPLGLTEGLKNAGALLTGGMVALVMTLMLWRRGRDRPARTAVAAVFDALALVVEQARVPGAPTVPVAAMPGDPPTVSAALTNARAVLADSRLGDAGGGPEAVRTLLGMEVAANLLPALVSLGDATAGVVVSSTSADPVDPDAPGTVEQMVDAVLGNVADGLKRAGHAYLMGHDPGPELERSQAIVQRLASSLLVIDEAGTRPIVGAVDVIYQRTRLLVGGEAVASEDEGPSIDASNEEVKLPAAAPPVGVMLRSAFSWESAAARHGVRLGLALAIGVGLNGALGVKHPAWILITIVVVLKPDFGSTWQTAGQRLFGTLIGAVAAAALVASSPSNVLILIVLAPLIGVMYALQRYSPVVFTALLSFFVLITSSLARPGDWSSAPERLVATGVGAVIAVVAILLLSPRDPAAQFGHALSSALQSNAAYLRSIVGAATQDERTLAGLTAARAAGNGLVALGQLQSEPPSSREASDDSSLLVVLDQQILRTALALDAMVSARPDDGPRLSGEITDAAQKLNRLGARFAPTESDEVGVDDAEAAPPSGDGEVPESLEPSLPRPMAAIVERLRDQVDNVERLVDQRFE